MTTRALAAIAFAALTALPGTARAQDALLLTHVHVAPMDAERILEDHAVLMRDGEIAWVGPAAEAPTGGAQVVDGEGAYVLPGFTDMHVHLRGGDDELDLYLLSGVTTVVNLSGRPVDLETRRRVAEGEVRGPTVYTTGPTIDGDPPRNSRFVPAGDANRGAAIVNEHIDAGYDFIKIYDLIESDAYNGATAAAHARGVPVVGHIPKKIGLEGILEGHDMIAHAEEYFYTWFGFEADETKIAEAARLTAEAGIAVTPNTGMIHSIIAQAEDLDAVLERPGIRYLPPLAMIRWLPETNRYVGRPAEWLARNKVMYPFLLKIVAALHEAGALLVTGSDAGVPGAEPGFSLLREIREFERAGLTPYEALRAATANPGDWIHDHLDDTRRAGRVEAGYAADLVVVDANPFESLDPIEAIHGIVLRGEWITRDDILRDVETRAEGYAEAMVPYQTFKAHVEAGRFAEAEALLGTSELFIEPLINALGYHYLGRGEIDTAIAVFAINTRAYPESGNTYDSLGEAYMEAGQRELAIENYEKSLELDPSNGNAVEMLEKLAEM